MKYLHRNKPAYKIQYKLSDNFSSTELFSADTRIFAMFSKSKNKKKNG